jgi:hypothetical protein
LSQNKTLTAQTKQMKDGRYGRSEEISRLMERLKFVSALVVGIQCKISICKTKSKLVSESYEISKKIRRRAIPPPDFQPAT